MQRFVRQGVAARMLGAALVLAGILVHPVSAVAAPESITYSKSSFAAPPAVITLMSAGGTTDGERVRDIHYRLDAGAVAAANASESIEMLPFPPRPDRVPSPLRIAPPIPRYAVSKSLILAGHTAGPDTGTDNCSSCHHIADPYWIQPPPWTSEIPEAWVPHATQDCNHCHFVGWIDPPITSLATTDVVVSALGTHTLEFWGVDRAGAEELPHKTHVFVIATPVIDTSTTISASTRRIAVGGSFILSGLVRPAASDLVGRPVRVEVKKPGRAYYSYSSRRTLFAGVGGRPTWWYRYFIRRGIAMGTYRFRCIFEGDPQHATSISPVLSVSVR